MRKWWRKFKNKKGWDFRKVSLGKAIFRLGKNSKNFDCTGGGCYSFRESYMVTDPNGCYVYICKYCGLEIKFPWRETALAYHNMQRHIKAKHIDVL